MKPDSHSLAVLRALVAKGGEAVEAVACAGTKLEAATFGVGKKVFLFASAEGANVTLRFKVTASRSSERLQVGANGWAKLTFPAAKPPAKTLLSQWIAESRAAVSPR